MRALNLRLTSKSWRAFIRTTSLTSVSCNPAKPNRFGFAGLQETEVRLVVRINARHDFDVRRKFNARIGVGQVAVPRVAKFMVAPGPLFFAGRDVMVGKMDNARLRGIIIAAKKI